MMLVASTSFAAHPLITEDTGTVGAGGFQLEVTRDQVSQTSGGISLRETSFSAVLSYGLRSNLDLVLAHSEVSVEERSDGLETASRGLADAEIAAKWRIYEQDQWSIALRPSLSLPTGDKNEGLGAGHSIPSLFAIATREHGPWNVHLHLGLTYDCKAPQGERESITHASLAATLQANEKWVLVADVSRESSLDSNQDAAIASAVVGAIFSPVNYFDIDLGYRSGLNDQSPDDVVLLGIAVRWSKKSRRNFRRL